jgi:hypothetical protein
MNSMMMHMVGALVHAPMKSTTFGCRSAVITRTSSLKLRSITFDAETIFLTATSVPFHVAL